MLLNNCYQRCLTNCYMYLYSGGPQVLIRTSALLKMAWYIAIHDHDNPVTQHGLASKFESQSFTLRSKVGVAFAQQESRSQQSAVSSQ